MIDTLRGHDASGKEAIQDRLLNAKAALKEQATAGSRIIKAYVRNEPARALGLAFGMGAILGWLIKRR